MHIILIDKKKVRLCLIYFFVVDRLQTHWEDSQTKLSDRTKQLHNMLQDSINWLDAKKRVDPQISRANEKLESMQEITYTVDDVKKLNSELKVQLEFHTPAAFLPQNIYSTSICIKQKCSALIVF